MNKAEFLRALAAQLSPLPWEEMESRWEFYEEIIADYMEEGLSEGQAVAKLGTPEEIAAQIIADTPLLNLVKTKIKPKRRIGVWEIVLLALGSPIWLSLGISVFAVILSLYISAWAVIISLWAVFVSFAACAIGGIAACAALAILSSIPSAAIMLAAGFICAGLSIFMFFGCKAVTKGILYLTKQFVIWMKHRFVKKEGTE